jgi:MFS family permease
MKDRIRKAGILFAALTVSASFTIVSPFYSKIAQDKGIEKWLIGLVYSSFPISSLAISFFLQPFMQRLGRTKILLFGMFLESLNILLMALVPFSNFAMALFLSFTSRMIGGWSSAMLTISSYSILTSDYPDEIAKMIALMEIVSGIGYIMGPLIGSIIYLIGGFSTSCIILSIIILLYTPILYICVGPSRPYILSNDHIIMSHVAMKPVYFI